MDKKTILGLVLIGAILFGFTWYNNRQAKKYEQERVRTDSIAMAEAGLRAEREAEEQAAALDSLRAAGLLAEAEAADMAPGDRPHPEGQTISADSMHVMQFGNALHMASQGEEETFTVDNDVMKVTFSNKGARITDVELKDYNNYNGQPVRIYEPGTAEFDIEFFVTRNMRPLQVNTANYYFNEISVSGPAGGEQTVAMRLPVEEDAYVEYIYTVRPDDYMVDFDVRFTGMQGMMSNSDLEVRWGSTSPVNEKGPEQGSNYSTITYKFPGGKGVEELGLAKNGKAESVNTNLQWVAFKQRFFSSVLIADSAFANAELKCNAIELPGENQVMNYAAYMAVPLNRETGEYGFSYYFGPNKYSLLKEYNLDLERLVPLGKGLIRWVNRFVVIPVFDFLGSFIGSYGLIILLLTIFIKILIFPLTYKSYLSGAKMRLIKPEVEAINEKYPRKEDAMKKQQATMELYKKAGINPMGGCLPLLIQFPILIAMFRFFPSSIELRGESFLWAKDLSSYDSIIDLPFSIPFYGDHISLFTLLMAVAMHFSGRISMSQQGASAAPGMGSMKFMTLWLMPVMMMFWFNNYSSGLSYYYLLSSIITIGQTVGVRRFVNDEKLHARMQATAKKPKKKSKWQQRYEEAVRTQQQAAKQGQGKGKKK